MRSLMLRIFLSGMLLIYFQQVSFGQYTFENRKSEKAYQQMEEDYADGDYAAILDKEDALLEYFEDKQDTLSALVYSFLGEAYLYWDGNLEKSLEFYQKEYDLRKKIGELEGNDLKDVIYNLGYLNDELGNYNKTESLYQELMAIDEKVFGKASYEYYLSAYALLDHYIYTREPEKGLEIVKDLKRSITKNSFEDAMVSKASGDLYELIGSFKKAEKELTRSIEILQDIDETASLEFVGVLNSLGLLYVSMGRLPEAESIYLEAIGILERLAGDNVEYEVTLKGNLAEIYTALGDFDVAEEIYQQNMEFSKEYYGEDSFIYGLDVYKLALNYLVAGEYDRSEIFHQIAAEIILDQLGEESFYYGLILNNLTIINTKKGQLELAKEYGEKAIANWTNSAGENHEYTGHAYFNLGNAFQADKVFDKAERLHLDALRIRRNVLGKNHPVYAKSTQKLAVLHWATDHLDEALEYYDETFENYFNQINTVFPILSEAEKTKFYYANLKPTFEQYNAFIVKSSFEDRELIGKMYDYQLAIKGLIFYASNKVRDAIINSQDTALIKDYETWIEMKEQTAKLLSATDLPLEARNLKIDSLSDLSNELEGKLSSVSGAFADTFVQQELTWKDVQKQLNPGEAAIEIIRFRDFTPDSAGVFTDEVFYAALIVTTETKDYPEMVIMRNGRLMETRYLANYRNAIRYKVADDFTYRLFWRPIANKLDGISRVYFSPDGVFNQISLYTLKNPETDQFIIDELEIRLLTNTKDLLARNSIKKEGGPSYLFGFPNYNMGAMEERLGNPKEDFQRSLRGGYDLDIENLTRGGSLPRGLRGNLLRYVSTNNLLALLPGTEAEVQKIDSLYQRLSKEAILYTSNEAVEDNIKQISSPEVLHVATHGFFLENNIEGETDEYVENPLLRCGLILAGANSYILTGGISDSLEFSDDGILTAYEAMNLNLDHTDLVVLSACETGLGVVKNGEGVYGMQRAFQVAGADAVIMSMWTVDDAATQELMTIFYEEWLSGKDKQQSFILAQKKLKEKWPSPYYWGAFVMVGN